MFTVAPSAFSNIKRHCCPEGWVTFQLGLHSCCFPDAAAVSAVVSCKIKVMLFILSIITLAQVTSPKTSVGVLLHSRIHTAKMRELNRSYFGQSLLNCKCCQKPWLIVVFNHHIIKKSGSPQPSLKLLNSNFALIKGLPNRFSFLIFFF